MKVASKRNEIDTLDNAELENLLELLIEIKDYHKGLYKIIAELCDKLSVKIISYIEKIKSLENKKPNDDFKTEIDASTREIKEIISNIIQKK